MVAFHILLSKVDIEKYFCAKRNEDVRNTNSLQSVSENGFDCLLHACHCVPQKLPIGLKVALCVAAVCFSGRH